MASMPTACQRCQHRRGIASGQHAHHGDGHAVDCELLGQRVSQRRHARGVVRAIDEQQRTPAQHLESSRHADGGESFLDDVGIECIAEEGFDGRQCD